MSRIELKEALDRLRAGEVVAIPTETVYGLAADATQEGAIGKVFATKGRPSDHPLIVHLGSADWASHWGDCPAELEALADRFWPGPLTLVVPRRPAVSPLITGGQDSVALRVPRHPLTLELLRQLGRPLVAPSANLFGHTSPTSAQHVLDEFQGAVPVLDGGPCQVGLESTILDLTHRPFRILRPGQLGQQELEEVLGPLDAAASRPRDASRPREASRPRPRVPGALDRHYAPQTPAYLGRPPGEASFGWLGLNSKPVPPEASGFVLLPDDPEGYARGLYGALRQLDRQGWGVLAIDPPPRLPGWEAIWDRLARAITPENEADIGGPPGAHGS